MSHVHIYNIGKAYKRYSKKWGRMAEWLGMKAQHELYWVLRDISFDVEPGESVGILGINGAGKSTLLKIIAGITKPITGKIDVQGSISSIIELGMGFHPNFTGRQNAYMGAQIRGIPLERIDYVIQSIEEFADIGDYFDQPMRTYSNGMQARVAFSVATAVRSDILIVDEVLSVGDAAFQRKCFSCIESFLNKGTSLLFVSHSTESVKRLCKKAIFLNHGKLVLFDEAKVVCDEYERFLFGPKQKFSLNSNQSNEENRESGFFDASLSTTNEISYTDGRGTIEKVWLENTKGRKINVLELGCEFIIKYQVRFKATVEYPVFAFLVKTIDGISLYGSDTKALGAQTGCFRMGDQILVSFKMKNHLAAGIYFLNCGIRDDASEKSIFVHRRVDVLMFKVFQSRELSQAGMVNLGAEFKISEIFSENQLDVTHHVP